MIDFNLPYSKNKFIPFLEGFLPEDYLKQNEEISLPFQTKYFEKVTYLGETGKLNLAIYEVKHSSESDARVGLTREMFRLMAAYGKRRSLVILVPKNGDTYRFSLVTIDLNLDENNRITKEYSNPKRYSFILGANAKLHTPTKTLVAKGRVKDFADLQSRFSVEVLTKEFYSELFAWYQWALSDEIGVTFPNDRSTATDDRKIEEHLIRLITRLMFVWFIKQKKLVPDELFDNVKLLSILKDFDAQSKTGDSYYRAILQNLFFATLNNSIDERAFAAEGSFNENRVQYGIKTLFRYASDFLLQKEEVINLFGKVPFLNGGLFECLDKDTPDSNGKIVYNDGFSRKTGRQSRAFVPNILFFEQEKGILTILNKYNFTIEENSPLDVEVALDPELLGKVFENLLGTYNPETRETARKQSGSFYTPREIVQYMVDESLIAHLKRTVGEEKEAEYRKLVSQAEEPCSLTNDEKSRVYHALRTCKILDPACGSGAFPMGILNRMLGVIEKLPIPPHISMYDLKLHLIENCIYGIDIQSIAVQISKLRFFISLVCEQTPTADPQTNYGIKPLPNLETKFVAANTLIGLTPRNAQRNLFEDPLIEVTRNELLQVRHRHFLANTVKLKKECRDEDKKLREKLARLLDDNGNFAPEDARQLADWNPYDQNATSPFFDMEWMFGIKEGFDVVIGNPPYVEAKKLKEISQILRKHYSTYSGTADLYVYFYENGISKLTQNGTLIFITSNKFIKTSYGENLRKHLISFKINEIIDFSDIHVFEALVASCIFSITKKQAENCEIKVAFADDTLKNFARLWNYIEQNKFFLKQNNLSEKIWQLENETRLALKSKIEQDSITLLQTGTINVYRGVTTGYNPAFIIDDKIRNELIDEDKTNKEIIKPILQGRNIRKWVYNETSNFIIFTRRGIEIKNYPSIKNYLEGFKKQLEPGIGRKPGSYHWYEIQDNTAYYHEFEKEKIIWGLTSDKWTFAYDNDGNYLPSNGYILTSKEIPIMYLLALLNSRLMEFYFGYIGIMTAGGAFTLKYETVVEFPIKNNQKIDYKTFINLVEHILSDKQTNPQADTRQQEQAIDLMVYKLYELTYDEAMIVDSELEQVISREDYEKAGVEELAEWEV